MAHFDIPLNGLDLDQAYHAFCSNGATALDVANWFRVNPSEVAKFHGNPKLVDMVHIMIQRLSPGESIVFIGKRAVITRDYQGTLQASGFLWNSNDSEVDTLVLQEMKPISSEHYERIVGVIAELAPTFIMQGGFKVVEQTISSSIELISTKTVSEALQVVDQNPYIPAVDIIDWIKRNFDECMATGNYSMMKALMFRLIERIPEGEALILFGKRGWIARGPASFAISPLIATQSLDKSLTPTNVDPHYLNQSSVYSEWDHILTRIVASLPNFLRAGGLRIGHLEI